MSFTGVILSVFETINALSDWLLDENGYTWENPTTNYSCIVANPVMEYYAEYSQTVFIPDPYSRTHGLRCRIIALGGLATLSSYVIFFMLHYYKNYPCARDRSVTQILFIASAVLFFGGIFNVKTTMVIFVIYMYGQVIGYCVHELIKTLFATYKFGVFYPIIVRQLILQIINHFTWYLLVDAYFFHLYLNPSVNKKANEIENVLNKESS